MIKPGQNFYTNNHYYYAVEKILAENLPAEFSHSVQKLCKLLTIDKLIDARTLIFNLHNKGLTLPGVLDELYTMFENLIQEVANDKVFTITGLTNEMLEAVVSVSGCAEPSTAYEMKQLIDSWNANQVHAKLLILSHTFKPQNSSVLLNIEKDDSMTAYKKNYLLMIWSLKIFVESGHNAEVGEAMGIKKVLEV